MCQLPRSREPTFWPPILCYLNPIRAFSSYLGNILVLSTQLRLDYLITFPYRNAVSVSFVSYACHMHQPTCSSISTLCIPRGMSSTAYCCGTRQLSSSQFLCCLRHTRFDASVCVIISVFCTLWPPSVRRQRYQRQQERRNILVISKAWIIIKSCTL